MSSNDKLVLRFCPYQRCGSLLDDFFDTEAEDETSEDEIYDVRLSDWNDDRKTRNLEVILKSNEDRYDDILVALKFGLFTDGCSLSCPKKVYGIPEGEEESVTFHDLPMGKYKRDDMVFAEIELIKLYNVPNHADKSPEEPSAQPKPITMTRPEPLGVSLKKLFGTGKFSDVTLSDGTTVVKAHKLILSVHSPVFAKMFQNPMKENLENRVLIEDVPMDVLKTLLDFMYSDAIEVSDRRMARELYIASEKYDVRILREICSEVLKSMDITNVIDTLILADLHNDEVLKQAALDFITENYSELKSVKEWKNLLKVNQALYLEALTYVVDKRL